jgi:hypothetical protein
VTLRPVRAVVGAALNAARSPFALRHDEELSLDGEVIGYVEHLAVEHLTAEDATGLAM